MGKRENGSHGVLAPPKHGGVGLTKDPMEVIEAENEHRMDKTEMSPSAEMHGCNFFAGREDSGCNFPTGMLF